MPAAVAKVTVPTREGLGSARAEASELRSRLIALQEELDWEVYRLYDLLDEDLTLPSDAVPGIALGERAFEIAMARKMAAGEIQTKWFERHGSTPITAVPADWPEPYRRLVERRLEVIASNPNVNLIERPEYKRRWNTEPWEEQEKRALRGWLLARLERPDCWPEPELQSAVRLADRVRHDPDFRQVAELYTARPDVDVEKLVAELVLEEGVPYLAALRYTDDGLRKRLLWERTWDLQRREDSGEAGVSGAKLDIPVPPKYGREDFLKGTYWSHRGKLDVPKEEFILYPGAERDVDPSPVVGWAGWDHLQRAKALANYYERVKVNEGWPKERLLPLLAGLHELVPWLKQWHDQLDPAFGLGMGTYFAQFVDEECRALGTLPEKLGEWRPEKRAGKARGRRKKEG